MISRKDIKTIKGWQEKQKCKEGFMTSLFTVVMLACISWYLYTPGAMAFIIVNALLIVANLALALHYYSKFRKYNV